LNEKKVRGCISTTILQTKKGKHKGREVVRGERERGKRVKTGYMKKNGLYGMREKRN
jgi:hypothetical protein